MKYTPGKRAARPIALPLTELSAVGHTGRNFRRWE